MTAKRSHDDVYKVFDGAPETRERWIRTVGRELSQQPHIRDAVRQALEPLEQAIGKLSIPEIHWLVMATRDQGRYVFPDGSEWPPDPLWVHDERAVTAGVQLVGLLEYLAGEEMAEPRDPDRPQLDPGDTSDLIALALVLYLDDIDWDGPVPISEVLYVGGVGFHSKDGRSITVSGHATSAQRRALESLRDERLPKIRKPDKPHERTGTYDEAVREALADCPNPETITADGIQRAVDKGEAWTLIHPSLAWIDRRTLQRALERVRGDTTSL